jgi:hypothetical protein
MQVTDGSASDNPVQGVNLTFLTTLERLPQGGGGPQGDAMQQRGSPQDGQPIILGTSQTQVVSDQNGRATITPTVGALGPCDAFITVTAGIANAQYELENVDALPSGEQPQPVRRSGSRSGPFIAFSGGPVAAPEESPTELFAFPQELSVVDADALEAGASPPESGDGEATAPEPPPAKSCPSGDAKTEAINQANDQANVPNGGKSCSPDLPAGGTKSSIADPSPGP